MRLLLPGWEGNMNIKCYGVSGDRHAGHDVPRNQNLHTAFAERQGYQFISLKSQVLHHTPFAGPHDECAGYYEISGLAFPATAASSA